MTAPAIDRALLTAVARATSGGVVDADVGVTWRGHRVVTGDRLAIRWQLDPSAYPAGHAATAETPIGIGVGTSVADKAAWQSVTRAARRHR